MPNLDYMAHPIDLEAAICAICWSLCARAFRA
jgi:hypothetical protein